ncbi:MAG: hypothetical protein ACK5QX_04085 [bacterium]|jgi:hypothetical protein
MSESPITALPVAGVNFLTSRVFLGSLLAIVAAGVVFNLGSQGKLGGPVKKLFDFSKQGYSQ